MNTPFIVAFVANQVWKQARRTDNGELRTVIGEGENYLPIYLDAKDEKALKEFLRNYFGPDIEKTY